MQIAKAKAVKVIVNSEKHISFLMMNKIEQHPDYPFSFKLDPLYFVEYEFVEMTNRYESARGCQEYHVRGDTTCQRWVASGASSRSEDSEYLPYVQWLGATVGWLSLQLLHLIISTPKALAMTSREHWNILMWSVCVCGDLSISWAQLSPRLCQVRWLRHCKGIGVHQGPALLTSAKLIYHLQSFSWQSAYPLRPPFVKRLGWLAHHWLTSRKTCLWEDIEHPATIPILVSRACHVLSSLVWNFAGLCSNHGSGLSWESGLGHSYVHHSHFTAFPQWFWGWDSILPQPGDH